MNQVVLHYTGVETEAQTELLKSQHVVSDRQHASSVPSDFGAFAVILLKF